MKKNTKNKSPKLKKVNSFELLNNLLSIKSFENDHIVFERKTSKYVSVLKIPGIDIFHFTESDQRTVFENFSRATRTLDISYKYIFTNQLPSLKEQKKYIDYKTQKTNHTFRKQLLERQKSWMEFIEANQRDRIAYLLLFSDSPEQLRLSSDRYISAMSDTGATVCVGSELKSAIAQILNFSASNEGEASTPNELVLPESIDFRQNYFKIGNRYVTDLIVYDYPALIKDLQFAALFNQFESNITITLDCATQSNDDAKSQIDASLAELKGRRSINQSDAEAIESESNFIDLQQLYAAISRGNEQMLSTTLRFYISESSPEQLRNTYKSVEKEIKQLGISCFNPEYLMQSEYAALVSSANTTGNAIPIEDTFKKQFPFYYQSLIDEKGTYFGETATGGQVIFDTFRQTKDRISFDVMLTGMKGSGKTATLKSMIIDNIIVGNKVMLFDLESEYGSLASKLGGKVLKLNKSSAINPLQLRKAVASNDDNADESNFMSEISRIEMFMTQYATGISPIELEAFSDALLDTYAEFGITEQTDIATLGNQDFPLLSDVLRTVQSYLKTKGLSENRKKILENVELYLKPIAIGAYASMFNGYTNLDFSDSDLIIFDVKALSELSEKVFNAQLSNILSIMWSEICKNVEYNNNISHPYDRRGVIAVIDEAARYIDSDVVLNYIVKLLRRSRKYDAALWFATQSMSDYKIDCSVLFGLVQYKMLLKQSADSVPLLKRIFPQFTESELYSLENFNPGEMLLSLGGGRQKLHCQKVIPDEDFLWIGNSRDKERLEGGVAT